MPKKRLKDLPEAEQEFIKNYVAGMCAFLSQCPPGKVGCDSRKQTQSCISTAMANEEMLIEKFGERWRKGIASALGLKLTELYDIYDTMTPEERGKYAWKMISRALDKL